MDKLQADKLTEIKANAELLQEEGYKSGLLDYVLYLLQLVETQAQALDEIDEIISDDVIQKEYRIKQLIAEMKGR